MAYLSLERYRSTDGNNIWQPVRVQLPWLSPLTSSAEILSGSTNPRCHLSHRYPLPLLAPSLFVQTISGGVVEQEEHLYTQRTTPASVEIWRYTPVTGQ